MRGRKPVPTRLKVLHGNPGRRPLNTFEPSHPSIDPECPAELVDPLARAEWSRLIGTLSHGHVQQTDRAVLVGYCLKYAQWQALEREAIQHPWIVRSANGNPMPNPALKLACRLFLIVLRSAEALGLTPTARARIVAPPSAPPPRDLFERLARRRGLDPRPSA